MEQYERGQMDDVNDLLNGDNDDEDSDVEEVARQLENGVQQIQEWWDS